MQRGGLEPEGVFGRWYDNRPLRYGDQPAADVQRYLELVPDHEAMKFPPGVAAAPVDPGRDRLP